MLGDRGVGKTSIVQVEGLKMFGIDEEVPKFPVKICQQSSSCTQGKKDQQFNSEAGE